MAGHAELGDFPPMVPILSDAQCAAQKNKLNAHKTNHLQIMSGVIGGMLDLELTTDDVAIHSGYNTYGFLPWREDPTKVICVEIYAAETQRLNTVEMSLRLLDGKKIPAARELASIGNETTAVIRTIQERQPVLFTQEAISGLVEQVFEQFGIEADQQQLNKPRGLARIRKLFSR